MNEKGDKNLEYLVSKMMKETSLETPSIDFTSKIMSQIEAITNSDLTTYRPLISKSVWIGLFALVIGVLAYSFFNNSTESNWLSNVDFSILTNYRISDNLSNKVFSKTMIYSLVLFAIMFAIQIPLLKVYFNKRASA